jgi:crotonobetainyl-CoA:carnitine CoA-transferase CaiB-like acyl-CoA transferase
MIPLLEGVRVLEIGAVVLGPYSSQILGDLGADVTKVEPIDGDVARMAHPGWNGVSALYVNNNRNKRSIAIDLKHPRSKHVLTRLIGQTDVLLHNMRPDAAARLGVDFDAARTVNPRIVHCAAVGFGRRGRYRDRPAFDDVIQAASGLAGLPCRLGDDPRFIPTNVADKVAALYVAYAILAALVKRERGHAEAIAIEVPMFESVVSFLMNEHLGAATFEADGETGYPRVLSPYRRPHRTSDGWLTVLPYTAQQWRRFLCEVGREDICGEPWFLDGPSRQARSDILYCIVTESLPGRTTAEWEAALERIDIPYSRVRLLEDLLDDPHLQDVEFYRTGPAYPESICRMAPQPVQFHGMGEAADRPPPGLGEDTFSILRDVGFGEAEIGELVAAGAVRAGPPLAPENSSAREGAQ